MVARLGSFASAARSIDADPSQVSRTIAGLESALGIRLFQRTTRQMNLTEAGELYLGRVEAIVDELDDARDQALALSSEPQGTLRLTTSVAFGHICLVPLISNFKNTFPHLDVDLVLTDENLDLVSNRIDLAIRLAPAIESDVISSKLFDTRYRVCASPAYISTAPPFESPNDIINHDVIQYALPNFRERWLFRDARNKTIEVPVKGTLNISNALVIRESVLLGLGPALMADWLIDNAIETGKCVDVFPNYQVTATSFETGAWLIYPNRQFLPNKVRVAINFLREHLTRVS